MQVELVTKISVGLDDQLHLISNFEGKVLEQLSWLNRRPGDKEPHDEDVELGTIVAARLHIGLAHELREELWQVCDNDSSLWESIYCCFLDDGGYKQTRILEDCVSGDLLLLYDIKLKREHRGRGIELAVADGLIDTIGAGCDLAIYYYGDHLWEVPIYAPMGFKRTKLKHGEEFLHLNLAHWHPKIRPIESPEDAVLFEVYDPRHPSEGSLGRVWTEKPPDEPTENELNQSVES